MLSGYSWITSLINCVDWMGVYEQFSYRNEVHDNSQSCLYALWRNFGCKGPWFGTFASYID